MGILCCCQSDSEEQQKLEDQKLKIPPEITITPKMKKAIKKMKLRKKELILLWKCFKKFGITEIRKIKKTTKNTFMTKSILSNYLKQPIDVFYNNLFDRWDLDRNDKVTFDEFLIGLYKFLLSSPSKCVEYIFETFDVDGDGYLMGPELGILLEELHGQHAFHALSAKTAMSLYDTKRDGRIDLDEWEESVANYPVLMWRVNLCKQRFIQRIVNEQFWYRLYIRLHPEMINDHHKIWLQNIKQNINQYINCCKITTNICIKLFQCMIWPICPCLKPRKQLANDDYLPKSPKSRYMVGQREANIDDPYSRSSKPEEVSLKIAEIVSNSASPSKSKRKSRLELTKINANVFSDTQEVEKRLDLEVIGDHDSSDSEIKQYVEKETRAQRLRQRQRY